MRANYTRVTGYRGRRTADERHLRTSTYSMKTKLMTPSAVQSTKNLLRKLNVSRYVGFMLLAAREMSHKSQDDESGRSELGRDQMRALGRENHGYGFYLSMELETQGDYSYYCNSRSH